MRPYTILSSSPSSCKTIPDVDILAAASENWFLHLSGYSDSAHRVWGTDKAGCVMWSMNPNNTAMQTWWLNSLRAKANNFDLFFVDMSPMSLANATYFPGSGGGCAPWPTVCTSTNELLDDAAVVAAHVGFMNAMSHKNGSPMHFIYQQAYPKLTEVDDLSAIAATPRIAAVTCEQCIANVGQIVVPRNYEPFLNEMAAVNATNAAFYILSDGDAPAGSATQVLQRLVTTGIVWLAYSEGHTIVHPNLEQTTNNLAIWPEDLIYPSSPLQTMRLGAADLQVAPGVWRREFATCYQKSIFFGHCAAVVNSTSSSVTIQASWLTRRYTHVVALSGGDVLSGGTASVRTTAFTPNVTQIQAGGALLLAQ